MCPSETIQEPLKKGIRTSAQSVSVTIASDQAAIPVSATIVGVATEVTLALIKTAVQSLETDVANGVKIDPTDLATIVAYIDGLETAIASTNTKLDTINGNVTDIETLTTTLLNKTQAGLFTSIFDEIVPTVDTTHDYYLTKLAASDRQLLTITYADATKAVTTNIKVITYA
jgi:hypothetical protein